MKIMIIGKPTCHLEKHKQDLTYGEFMVWIQQGKLKKKTELPKYETRTTVCMALTGNGHKHILLTFSSTIDEF